MRIASFRTFRTSCRLLLLPFLVVLVACKSNQAVYEVNSVYGTDLPCPTEKNRKKHRKNTQGKQATLPKKRQNEPRENEESTVKITPIPHNNLYGKSFDKQTEPKGTFNAYNLEKEVDTIENENFLAKAEVPKGPKGKQETLCRAEVSGGRTFDISALLRALPFILSILAPLAAWLFNREG